MVRDSISRWMRVPGNTRMSWTSANMKRCVRELSITGFVLPLPSTPVSPHALNPPYLSHMPAPARVLAEIKGRDAEDTMERQMGAFQWLVQIIDEMAYGLGHRYVDV